MTQLLNSKIPSGVPAGHGAPSISPFMTTKAKRRAEGMTRRRGPHWVIRGKFV
jgi:hypothetical protein